MYHYAKSGRKKGGRPLGAVCVLLSLVLAVLLLWALAPAPGNAVGTVTLVYRGELRVVPGSGGTGGALLDELGLALTEEDVVSLPLDTALSPGAVVTVERHQRRREVYTLALEPEREYRLDDTLPWGEEALLAAGEVGELRCTAWVDYVNGVETGREVVEKELLRPVRNELVAIGTCEHPVPTGENGYLWLPDGEMLTYTHTASVEATGFTGTDAGALPDACPGTVAVDPAFITPGTRLYIVSEDGFCYGVAQARAGSVQGRRIDLYFPTQDAREEFGRRQCTVYFLG